MIKFNLKMLRLGLMSVILVGTVVPMPAGAAEPEMKIGKALQILKSGLNGAPAAVVCGPEARSIASGCRSGQSYKISLTFDDGPSPAYTGRILDTLKKHHVTAAFFVLGETFTPLSKHPEHRKLIERMYREGHTIGTHTYHHVPHNLMTAVHATEDIARAGSELSAYLAPILRLPGGDGYYEMQNASEAQKSADHQIMQLVKDQGYVHVGWDIVSNDTVAEKRPFIRQSLLNQICATHGGVILMHDIQFVTASHLDEWITAIEAAGHTIVPLSEFVPEAALKWSDVNANGLTCTPQRPVDNHGAVKGSVSAL